MTYLYMISIIISTVKINLLHFHLDNSYMRYAPICSKIKPYEIYIVV